MFFAIFHQGMCRGSKGIHGKLSQEEKESLQGECAIWDKMSKKARAWADAQKNLPGSRWFFLFFTFLDQAEIMNTNQTSVTGLVIDVSNPSRSRNVHPKKHTGTKAATVRIKNDLIETLCQSHNCLESML